MFERRIIRKDMNIKDIYEMIETYGPAGVIEGLFEYLSEKNVNEYPYIDALESVGGGEKAEDYRKMMIEYLREDLLDKLLEIRDFSGIYFERGDFGEDERYALLEENAVISF